MREGGLVERVWWGEDRGARVARGVLLPLSLAFEAAVRVRGALYDVGALPSRPLALPAVSVGNLSVGGTGKTPVAAWIAGQLRDGGATPAIVLRGYGGDEPLVHEALSPGAPVIVGADRVEAVSRAAAAGATVAVLDDAFQHRRAKRDLDLVLVSAERWTSSVRVLPAGPWREPLSGLRRASMVLVTRKSATAAYAARVADELAARLPGLPLGALALMPHELVRVDGDDRLPLSALRGRRIAAIAAIGDPGAFLAQLRELGAVVDPSIYPDHHAFSDADIRRLIERAQQRDLTVCTLKDAVKLKSRWPRQAPPFWYVSQHVAAEQGRETLGTLLSGVIRAASGRSSGAAPPVHRPLS